MCAHTGHDPARPLAALGVNGTGSGPLWERMAKADTQLTCNGSDTLGSGLEFQCCALLVLLSQVGSSL